MSESGSKHAAAAAQTASGRSPILEKTDRCTTANYARYPIAFVSGHGCRLKGDDGREYLDLFSGLAVSSLGHGHPALVRAIQSQAQKLIHTSNLFYHEPGALLAERLVELTFADRVFFCNSGAEANEAAIKMARRASSQSGRFRIVAAHRSFHGRTYGALAATGQPELREGFGPMPEGFVHVEAGSAEAVSAAIDAQTAAVIVEPIIGEGGVLVPPAGYLRDLRRICDDSGTLLILDEVQTGNGRTGKLFAYEHEGIEPDILTTAKGLAGGLPIGAVLARQSVAASFVPGSHGTTFGANPVACAAALAVIGELVEGGVMENVTRVGRYLVERLRSTIGGREDVTEIRGRGLMIGIEFKRETKPMVRDLFDCGVITNSTAGNVLRLIPPLILSEAEVDEGVQAIAKVLG